MTREATCNDASEPQVQLMRELAKGTFTVEFSAIMAIIWRRIKEEKNERHPLKCLKLLEFLLREGNTELVLQQIKNNLHLVQQLTRFRLINENHIDVGMPVRERAERFLAFVRDEPVAESEPQGEVEREQWPSSSNKDGVGNADFKWEEDKDQYNPPPRPGGGGKFQVKIRPKESPAAGAPASASPDLMRASTNASDPFASSNDPFASGQSDPFQSSASSNDPFAASALKSSDPFASANDPFSSSAPNDPFASSAPNDPFASSAVNDPFASSGAKSHELFASSAAADPFGAPPASLLESPAARTSQEELMSLALPQNIVPGAVTQNLVGQNDMQLLGNVDLASPGPQTVTPQNSSPKPDARSEPAIVADPYAIVHDSNIVNLDNISLSKAEAAATPHVELPSKKLSMAEMAATKSPAAAPNVQQMPGAPQFGSPRPPMGMPMGDWRLGGAMGAPTLGTTPPMSMGSPMGMPAGVPPMGMGGMPMGQPQGARPSPPFGF